MTKYVPEANGDRILPNETLRLKIYDCSPEAVEWLLVVLKESPLDILGIQKKGNETDILVNDQHTSGFPYLPADIQRGIADFDRLNSYDPKRDIK